MHEINKIDAFALIVKTLERGDEKKANKMMRVVVRSIQKNKDETRSSLNIKIRDEKDANLFKDLLIGLKEE